MATQTIAMPGMGMHPREETALRIAPRRDNRERLTEKNQELFAAQQKARRGPTPEVFFMKRFDNSRLVKAADPARSREMRSFAAAMALLFVLTMVYGWQHLSSIEYGYRIESEKQQVDSLNEANRQLRLSEAQLGDPARIDRMARALGLDQPQPGQVVRPDMDPDPNAPALAEVSPVTPTY